MKLLPPFIPGPALKIGGATLTLISTTPGRYRHTANFALDIPGQPEYLDSKMQSGCNGFRGKVETFDAFLLFLVATELKDLFPERIREWAQDNKSEIEKVQMSIQFEGSFLPNEGLINED